MTGKKKTTEAASLTPTAIAANELWTRIEGLVGDAHPMKFYYYLNEAAEGIDLDDIMHQLADDTTGYPPRLVAMLKPLRNYRPGELWNALGNLRLVSDAILSTSNYDSIFVSLESVDLTPDFMNRARTLHRYLLSTAHWMSPDDAARMMEVADFHDYWTTTGFGTMGHPQRNSTFDAGREIRCWLHYRLLEGVGSWTSVISSLSPHRWGAEEFRFYETLSETFAMHLDRIAASGIEPYANPERAKGYCEHSAVFSMCQALGDEVGRRLAATTPRETKPEPIAPYLRPTRDEQRAAMGACDALMEIINTVKPHGELQTMVRHCTWAIEDAYSLAPFSREQGDERQGQLKMTGMDR